jgi:hypothetical protein
VTNAGPGESPATAVAASVPGVGATAAEVRQLEPGGSAAVPLSLDVGEREPLQARLTVTVDPGDAVEEQGEGNNSDVRTVTVGTPTRRPDLTVKIESTAQRGDRLELSIRVTNTGDRRASTTRADVSAPGFETVEQEVRALTAGGETVLTATLRIPEPERGRDVVVAATVDPLGAVQEQDEGNNRSRRTVAIAVAKRPDLTVRLESVHQNQGRLDFETRVVNRGNGSAPVTAVEITVPGLDKATALVPPLDPGDTVALPLTLGVPASERGAELPVVATVDPANRVAELREDNNRGETRVAIEKAGHATWLGRPVWPFWSLMIAVAGVALVIGIGIKPSIRIVRHERRRSEARDEEPPDECRHCTRYTRKVELELKPARRKIAHLELQARDADGHERTRELKGKIVDELNRAVRRHRRKRPNEDLRRALDPVAAGIVAEVEEWLADETVDADVSIEAHIVGGKVECTFTVYHCIHGEWEEEDSWSEELEDERDERVAGLPFPLVSRAEACERLLGELTAFVTRVDVEAERPPEAMPLPQG